jgi:simple sugar transport system substrate-binding protein
VTTNPFFVPTRYGAEDACKLLGCSYQFTGSKNSNVNEMVNAFNTAGHQRRRRHRVCLVDKKAFNQPVDAALKAKIPVLAYNADETSNARLAYIGQDLFVSAWRWARRSRVLVPSGDVALFIATPGSPTSSPGSTAPSASSRRSRASRRTSSPRARSCRRSCRSSTPTRRATPTPRATSPVDAGSTQGLAQTIQKQKLRDKGVKGGGYDLTPVTQKLLAGDQIDFTIDQQPYLQGFFPIMELYLAKASETLSGVADVNTGLKFLDKTTVAPYNSTKSRYEGTSSSPGCARPRADRP